MMRALLLPMYARKAASARHRFLQYVPALTEAGIDCDIAPLFDDEYLVRRFDTGRIPLTLVARGFARRIGRLLRTARYDLVVVHYELFPYLPRWFERLFTWPRISYVVDFDDAVFLRYADQASRIVRWLAGDKMKKVFAEATLVVAGNEYLASYARQTAKRVDVVPTTVDTDIYTPGAASSGVRDRFTIGWIGSPSTSAYLESMAGTLRSICARDGCRFIAVGAGNLFLDGVPMEKREWSEETEVRDIREFDVGIMPLPDTPWTRGKCGFKLIQYMACGLPVVASRVGVNSELVDDGVSGFLATDEAHWASALTALRDDPSLRRRMGLLGRSKVERSYSLRAMAPRLIALFQEAASTRAAGASAARMRAS